MRKNIVTTLVALAVAMSATFGSVLPAFAAVSAPTNLTISSSNKSTNDTTPTFTWTAPSGATWYEAQVDNGNWFSLGNTQSYTLWNQAEGWHTFFVRAHNNAGEISTTSSFTFEIDTYGPTLPMLYGEEREKTGATAWYSTYPTGESPTAFCDLYENGKNVGGMTRSTYSVYHQGETTEIAKFTKGVTFTSAGSYSLYARCADADGNYSSSAKKTVTVTGSAVAPTPTTPVVSVAKGTVVKTACDSYAPKSDSCHSIYYYGTDGKRHAFPTESVYMSWFSNYNNVVTITNSTMKAMKVGENITYHPGTVLVKFSGSSTVYAIEQGGVLRPFMNEAAAIATYGRNYSRYIVTMSTSMKSDYGFGAKIWSSGDYSKVAASASTIDKNYATKIVID